MSRSEESQARSYNLDNCFGFDESDINLSLWEKSSVMDDKNTPLEFQPDKPYRLALYVRPVEQKRLQRNKAVRLVQQEQTATSMIIKTIEKPRTNKKSERSNKAQAVEKKEVKRSARLKEKVKIMLFDENIKPENISKKIQMTQEKDKPDKNITENSTRENVLREINTKSLTRTKRNKVRRSYEKKFKEKEETENILEPSSEQILKEIEFKKLSRTKPKKTAKEQQEFEKWANNMNSAFDDVDKFELSIAYD